MLVECYEGLIVPRQKANPNSQPEILRYFLFGVDAEDSPWRNRFHF